MTAPWWARRTGAGDSSNSRDLVLRPGAVARTSRSTWTKRATTATIGITALGLVLAASADPEREPYLDGFQTRQTPTALLAECGPRFDFPSYRDTGRAVPPSIEDAPNLQEYPTVVPVSGAFWDLPVTDRTQGDTALSDSPYPEQMVAALWRGAVVVYVTDATTTKDPLIVADLEAVAEAEPSLDLYVVRWRSERGPLPLGRSSAIAAWGASQSCDALTVDVVREFRRAHPPQSAPGFFDPRGGGAPPEPQQGERSSDAVIEVPGGPVLVEVPTHTP